MWTNCWPGCGPCGGATRTGPNCCRSGQAVFDRAGRCVRRADGTEVELSGREARTADRAARPARAGCSAGRSCASGSSTRPSRASIVDTYVHYLRRKLGAGVVRTVRGLRLPGRPAVSPEARLIGRTWRRIWWQTSAVVALAVMAVGGAAAALVLTTQRDATRQALQQAVDATLTAAARPRRSACRPGSGSTSSATARSPPVRAPRPGRSTSCPWRPSRPAPTAGGTRSTTAGTSTSWTLAGRRRPRSRWCST